MIMARNPGRYPRNKSLSLSKHRKTVVASTWQDTESWTILYLGLD